MIVCFEIWYCWGGCLRLLWIFSCGYFNWWDCCFVVGMYWGFFGYWGWYFCVWWSCGSFLYWWWWGFFLRGSSLWGWCVDEIGRIICWLGSFGSFYWWGFIVFYWLCFSNWWFYCCWFLWIIGNLLYVSVDVGCMVRLWWGFYFGVVKVSVLWEDWV